MSENTVSQPMVVVNEKPLSYVENKGEMLFSSEEVGKHLGYAEPAEAINRIFKRNEMELEAYATSVKLTAVDGKQRQVRHFTEEGVYILSMLANTEKAVSFRAYFAKVLREVRKKQREFDYAQGIEYAQSKPAMQALRQEGKLEGIKEASNPRTDRLAKMRHAIRYLERGFTLAEAAKMIDMRRETLRENLVMLGLRKGKKRYGTHRRKAATHTMPKGE